MKGQSFQFLTQTAIGNIPDHLTFAPKVTRRFETCRFRQISAHTVTTALRASEKVQLLLIQEVHRGFTTISRTEACMLPVNLPSVTKKGICPFCK